MLFSEKAECVDPEMGRTMKCETEELGEAIIPKLGEGQSAGEFKKGHACDAVYLSDRVITRWRLRKPRRTLRAITEPAKPPHTCML